MAFNLAFPCNVDISGETTITHINTDASITLNDGSTNAGFNPYSMTYTDVATENELAHYNSNEMAIQDLATPTNKNTISSSNITIISDLGPGIVLNNTTSNQIQIGTGNITATDNVPTGTIWNLDQNGLSINDPTTFAPRALYGSSGFTLNNTTTNNSNTVINYEGTTIYNQSQIGNAQYNLDGITMVSEDEVGTGHFTVELHKNPPMLNLNKIDGIENTAIEGNKITFNIAGTGASSMRQNENNRLEVSNTLEATTRFIAPAINLYEGTSVFDDVGVRFGPSGNPESVGLVIGAQPEAIAGEGPIIFFPNSSSITKGGITLQKFMTCAVGSNMFYIPLYS